MEGFLLNEQTWLQHLKEKRLAYGLSQNRLAVATGITRQYLSDIARAVVAMAGSFGYELDVNQLCEKDKEEIRYQIEAYKKYQSLIHDGIYDRLSNPYENHTYTAWQFTSEDKSEVLVNYVLTKKHANEKVYYLYLRNLEEEAFYQDKENGKIYTGAALMYGGLPMPRNIQEYEAVQLYFERLEKSN